MPNKKARLTQTLRQKQRAVFFDNVINYCLNARMLIMPSPDSILTLGGIRTPHSPYFYNSH